MVDINPNTNNQNKIPGNTLDFYNEDMSRKAVGKLFDETSHGNNNVSVQYNNHINSGTNSGSYQDISLQQEQFAPRPQIARNSGGYPDFNAQRSHQKENVISKVSYEDLGISEKNRKRGTDRMSDSGRFKRISELPSNPNQNAQRHPQSGHQPTSKIATVPRSPAGNQSRMGESRKYIANDNKLNDTYDMIDDGSQKILKYVFAGVLFVLVLILFLLLLRINGLQRQIVELSENFDTIQFDLVSASDLAIRIDGLDSEIGSLRSTVSEFSSPQITTVTDTDTDTSSGEQTIATPDAPAAGGAATTTAGEPRTYTVQSGDTLSRVAEMFYGASNPELWERIRAANGMTNDNLRPGTVLIIP